MLSSPENSQLKIVPIKWLHVVIALGVSIAAYFLIAVLLFKSTPGLRDTWLARVLADQQHVNLGSYCAFSVALVLLVNRFMAIRNQNRWISADSVLPSDHQLLFPDDGLELRRNLKELPADSLKSIPLQMLDAGLQQSRVAWSPPTVTDAIKTRAETIQGQTDAEYGIIKYLIWAIPSIGFCGTVYGLGAAIGAMRRVEGVEISDDDRMQNAIGSLFTAFDTTLIALILSIILMFIFHVIQSKEDSFIANSLDWCVRRFALRMHRPEEETA